MADPSGSDDVYELKRIEFGGRPVAILLQNRNGPCPLLAIANVLLLRGDLDIHHDQAHISFGYLVSMLGEYLIERDQLRTAGSAAAGDTPESPGAESLRLNRQQTISDTLSLLPALGRGLDVNVRFGATDGFEYTRELGCFDAFSVGLRHGQP